MEYFLTSYNISLQNGEDILQAVHGVESDINEIKNELENSEKAFHNKILDYCDSREFKSATLGYKIHEFLSSLSKVTQNYDVHLQEVHFNSRSFAVNYLKSSYQPYVEEFLRGGTTYAVVSHYHIMTLTQNGTFIKLDFSNGGYKQAIGKTLEKQFAVGSELQRKMLINNPPNFEFNLQDHNSHKEIADCFIRPETHLREREEEWKLVFKIVQENSQLNSYKLMTETDCSEYATCRIFQNYFDCLQTLQMIFPVFEIQQQLQKNRYDLEHLRDLPHVQAMRSCLEMQKMVQRYPKYVQLLKLSIRNQIILNNQNQGLKNRISELKQNILNLKNDKIDIIQRVERIVSW